MTRGRRVLESLEDDIRDHIERETRDNMGRGMAPEEARRQALLTFGNVALVKEGLAWVSPSIPVTKVRAELEVAGRQAQVGKYGLWALPDPVPPWEFRKRHRLPAD